MKKCCYLFLLCFLWTCKNTTGNFYQQEVEALTTVEAQTEFLEAIFDLDQQVRREETKIMEQFGHNSTEHQDALRRTIEIDEEHLIKVETYLATHGHPKRDVHSSKATDTPWLVIHHAQGGEDPRVRNFPYIYQAWKEQDIDDRALTFYLNRLYDMKFGDRLIIESPFTVDFEVDTLIKAIGLVELREEVDQKLKN